MKIETSEKLKKITAATLLSSSVFTGIHTYNSDKEFTKSTAVAEILESQGDSQANEWHEIAEANESERNVRLALFALQLGGAALMGVAAAGARAQRIREEEFQPQHTSHQA